MSRKIWRKERREIRGNGRNESVANKVGEKAEGEKKKKTFPKKAV